MKPTGAHREELVDELLMKERTIAKLKEKLKADTKLQRDKIGALEDRRDELLDLLEGREHVAPELPLLSPGRGGKKDDVKPISWSYNGPDEWHGKGAKGREYFVRNGPRGWSEDRPGSGVGCGGSGPYKTVDEAKRRAEERELEMRGDAILENAGDGKLTKGGRRKLAAAEKRP